MTSPSELQGLVGQRVELVGVVTDTKIPQIMGVDVPALEDHRGQRMKVVGVLRQTVVTQADIDAMEKQMGGAVANRGPGTFYHFDDVKYEATP